MNTAQRLHDAWDAIERELLDDHDRLYEVAGKDAKARSSVAELLADLAQTSRVDTYTLELIEQLRAAWAAAVANAVEEEHKRRMRG